MTGQIRKVSLVVMILSTWDRRSRGESGGTALFRGESFNWTLSKGVLTLSDNRGRNIRVVILSYTEEEIQASYDCTFESEMYTEEGNYTFKRV